MELDVLGVRFGVPAGRTGLDTGRRRSPVGTKQKSASRVGRAVLSTPLLSLFLLLPSDLSDSLQRGGTPRSSGEIRRSATHDKTRVRPVTEVFVVPIATVHCDETNPAGALGNLHVKAPGG